LPQNGILPYRIPGKRSAAHFRIALQQLGSHLSMGTTVL